MQIKNELNTYFVFNFFKMNYLQIRKIRKELGLTQKQFAKKLGFNTRTVQKWEGNETKIRPSTAILIKNMQESRIKGVNNNSIENTNGNKFTELPDGSLNISTKLLSFDVFASYKNTLENGVPFEDFEEVSFNVVKYGRGNYMAFKITGHSMNGGGINDTPDGALVLGRELGRNLWQDGFYKNEYGFIILSQDGIFHKDITGIDKETGDINCSSRNKSKDIVQNFKLNLNEVYQIFKVIKRTF